MKNKIKNFLHKMGIHFWVYRNPYNRTCSICDKNQHQHVFAIEGTDWMRSGHTWWEDMI